MLVYINDLYFPKNFTMHNLKIGDKAPGINAIDQDENHIGLEQYSGKKVVLYFYPKDNTPGCTIESCDLRDNYHALLKQGYEVIGVSADSARKHRNFIKKFKLPFRLIADTDKIVLNDYGVWGEKKFMGRTYQGIHRTTFIISENGIIEDIIKKVKTLNHTKQVLSNKKLISG